jgi:phosphatidate phosphatase APP1
VTAPGSTVARFSSRAADQVRAWWRRRRFYSDPIVIHPFRGHGTDKVLHLKGRVLEEAGIGRASPLDPLWRNLVAMVRRFESDEIGGARVVARFGGQERELLAGHDGYFDLSLELTEPLPHGSVWHGVELELLAPRGGPGRQRPGAVRAVGHVLVPQDPDFAVVSDLDDTVIRTSVTDLLAMARLVLLGNSHTRLPFEGVAAFYRALRGGPSGRSYNPIFYVSSGPWNLYDLIEEFLDLNGIPLGPIFLRDWGWPVTSGGPAHKIGVIRRLIEAYPEMRFVLIGDSGEKDPEIYRTLVLEHPGRVLAVYIRAVGSEARNARIEGIAAELAGAGVPMLLVQDTVAAATHARSLGLLAPETVPSVREERREEVAQPEPSVLGPEGTKPGSEAGPPH